MWLSPSPPIEAAVILTTATKILQSSAISGEGLVISMPFVIHRCLWLFPCSKAAQFGRLGLFHLGKCDFCGDL